LRDEDAPVYLVRNDYKSAGYPCTIYNSHDHAAIIDYAVSSAQLGKRLFIGTDSKNASEVMAELAVAGVKPDRILVVNGDTSGEQQQRKYISQINHRISDYDIVIATGSLATGVSFELEWFDEVIGVFYGVVPDSDVAQALARVRVPIPRTIWIAKQGKNFNKVSKSEYPSVVKRMLKTGWEKEVALIRSSLNPDLVPHVDAPVDWDNCPHKNLWAQTVADNNFSMWNLRDCVIARLKHEGNQVQVISVDTEKDFRELVKEVKQEIKTNHCHQVSNATVLSPEEQESLQSKEGLSTEERLNLEKTAIAQFTCSSEVSPELVAAYPELVATIPRYEDLRHNLAIERDEKAIARQVKWGQGLFIPDLPTREQERLLRERLGLIEWIDKLRQGENLTNEDLEPLGELVRNCYRQVNEVLRLGFSCESKNWSNVRIFNALVKQLGIPTVTKRVGKETKITSTSLDLQRWGLVDGILERREAKRQQLNQQKTEPMVMEEQQFQVDNGSYINKQVPLSTNTIAPPAQIEALPALSQEDIAGLAEFLMTADTPEVVVDVFGMIRWVCKETKQAKEAIQKAKEAIWALIPREKRAQLWKMAATG